MILLEHACGFATSLVEWDAKPHVSYITIGDLLVPLRKCDCGSDITVASLLYLGCEDTNVTIERLERSDNDRPR